MQVASMRVAFVFGLWITLAAPASAVEFSVARNGDDRGPGTIAEPFATLERAQRAVREFTREGLQEPVTVVIREGVYRRVEPLVFGVADGGTAEQPVVWKAARGERVVISGGRPIEGWTAEPNGLWWASVPRIGGRRWQFRELFVDGERRTRARHPNGTFARVVAAGPDRRHSFVTTPNSFPPLSPDADAELVFLHDWSISRIPVAETDPASGRVVLSTAVGAQAAQFAIDHFEPNPRFFLENAPAYLDEAGEWYLRASNERVFCRPTPNDSIEQFRAVAPVAEALIVVRGDEEDGTPVRNLHFAGLAFEHCAWMLPTGGYAGIQAGFYDVRTPSGGARSPGPIPAAVSFRIAEGCSVTDSAFRHLGGSGIELGSRCRYCSIARTLFRDISANGIVIGESDARHVPGGHWVDAAPEQVATGNVVEECLIERCGAQFFGGVGVWIGLTEATTIRGNLIRDLPYTGISVGWRWNAAPTPARENRIVGNHIHDIMQLLSDGGGVYTLGAQPGTVVAGNRIHGVPKGVGRAESNGIFVDEGTTGLTFEGNIIFDVVNSPMRFHRTGSNVARGNLLAVRAGIPPFRYNSTPETNIRRDRNSTVPADRFRPPPAIVGPSPEVREQLRDRWGR